MYQNLSELLFPIKKMCIKLFVFCLKEKYTCVSLIPLEFACTLYMYVTRRNPHKIGVRASEKPLQTFAKHC